MGHQANSTLTSPTTLMIKLFLSSKFKKPAIFSNID